MKTKIINAIKFGSGFLSIAIAIGFMSVVFSTWFEIFSLEASAEGRLIALAILASVGFSYLSTCFAYWGIKQIESSFLPGIAAGLVLKKGEMVEVIYTHNSHPNLFTVNLHPFDAGSRVETIRLRHDQKDVKPRFRYYFDGRGLRTILPIK